MKFRNRKTGEVFKNDCDSFCGDMEHCASCPIGKIVPGIVEARVSCIAWVKDNPYAAAALMGYDIVDDESVNSNPYWERISELAAKQRAKGIATYGQGLEANVLPVVKKLNYIQEELIDALMYIEWVKDSLVGSNLQNVTESKGSDG